MEIFCQEKDSLHTVLGRDTVVERCVSIRRMVSRVHFRGDILQRQQPPQIFRIPTLCCFAQLVNDRLCFGGDRHDSRAQDQAGVVVVWGGQTTLDSAGVE